MHHQQQRNQNKKNNPEGEDKLPSPEALPEPENRDPMSSSFMGGISDNQVLDAKALAEAGVIEDDDEPELPVCTKAPEPEVVESIQPPQPEAELKSEPEAIVASPAPEMELKSEPAQECQQPPEPEISLFKSEAEECMEAPEAEVDLKKESEPIPDIVSDVVDQKKQMEDLGHLR